ncbi:MAG: amidohydrolase, partial [Pseudomonadota bacterium]
GIINRLGEITFNSSLIKEVRMIAQKNDLIESGDLVVIEGRIAAVGEAISVPEGALEIDGTGKWVTPGIIDVHSHLGVYPSPAVPATSDGNEATDPVTSQVWAEHSVWTQDPGFTRALAGGVTSLAIFPGSANLFGGRTVTLKNVPSRTVQGMKFPDAPHGLKMACGENPKRVYGEYLNRTPATRMGNFAGYRQTFTEAAEYKRGWDAYVRKAEAGEAATPPARKLKMDTLASVLSGDILVHMHCYRADEMAFVLDLADEFGFKVTSFHHAIEAYKIADLLAEADACSAVWADWWGFKLEAYDTVNENAALIHNAGACSVIHSDSPYGIQRLNQDTAKAMAAGQAMGLEITPEDAIGWITLNAARSLGIDEETGSLAEGKAADVVVWSGDPFSVYTEAEKVFIDGALIDAAAIDSSWTNADEDITVGAAATRQRDADDDNVSNV